VIVAAEQPEHHHPISLVSGLPASMQDQMPSMLSLGKLRSESGTPAFQEWSPPRPAMCAQTASPMSHHGFCSSPSPAKLFPDTPSPCALHRSLLLGPAYLAGLLRASDVAEPGRISISLISSILSDIKPKPRLQLSNLIKANANTEAATDGRRCISLFDSLRHGRSFHAQNDSSPVGSCAAGVHAHKSDSQKLSAAGSVTTCTTLYASTPSPVPMGWVDLPLHVSEPDAAHMHNHREVQRSLCSLFDSTIAELGDEVQIQCSVDMDAARSPSSPPSSSSLSSSSSSSSVCGGCQSKAHGCPEQLVNVSCESGTASNPLLQGTGSALPHLLGRTKLASQARAEKQSFEFFPCSDAESAEPDHCSNTKDFSVSLRNTFLHASPLRTSARWRARSMPRPAC